MNHEIDIWKECSDIEHAGEIIREYLNYRGCTPSTLHTTDIEFWAIDKNIIPDKWTKGRRRRFISLAIPKYFKYKKVEGVRIFHRIDD